MKFSLSWLKKHLDTDATLDQVVETMIRVGLEVEEIDNPAERLAAITIGEVLEAEKHPDADKLKVCKVKTKDGVMQIVCGAPNARAGIKVAYAPVGTYVPGIDTTLSKAKIRGVESLGMMCSARELEMGDDHDGIIEAPQDATVGAGIVDVMGGDDPVIDFEVTPNRPDTNGVMSVARDLAAAGLGTFISEEFTQAEGGGPCTQEIALELEGDAINACPVFGGILVRGVKNGPSPEWLQQALLSIGLRPINALVDMTNYISVDRARPLHVYDAAKLSGPIRARLAKAGESFEALDGKEYTADETMTVIADDERVLGFGGIMGGTYSGCTQETTDVFIECAYFDPTRTAKTGRKTGIISDARYRFERGIDPQSITSGLAQATRMVLDLCGGTPSQPLITGAIPTGTKLIEFPTSEVKRLLGIDVPEAEMVQILGDLGFIVENAETNVATWQVLSPSWRPDIDGKADIVEEIARIKGLEALASTPLPRLATVEAPKYSPAQNRVRRTKRALAVAGFDEVVTWSFCDEDDAKLFGGGQDVLKLANPIASDLGVMRPTILPCLLAAVRRNVDRGMPHLALFEVGPAYDGDQPTDQKILAVGVRRSAPQRHWQGADAAADVFRAKADALTGLEAAGAPTANLQVTADAPAWYHPGRSGVLRLGPKNALAYFGELHPRVLKAMDVDGPVYGFELMLDNIPAGKAKATKTKSALDASDLLPLTRDFAFIVSEDTPADKLLKALRGADKKMITDVTLFDVYQGKGIEEGEKSLAVEVTLQPREKTLTDEEIEAISSRIIAQAEKATGAKLRG